jgi:hypothetical protein
MSNIAQNQQEKTDVKHSTKDRCQTLHKINKKRPMSNIPQKTDVKHSTKASNDLTWINVISLEDKHNINVMSSD